MLALRDAFHRHHGLQCGFCTPGMLVSARDLIQTWQGGQRQRDTQGIGRQYLPLYRLHRHRQVGAQGRRGPERGRQGPTSIRRCLEGAGMTRAVAKSELGVGARLLRKEDAAAPERQGSVCLRPQISQSAGCGVRAQPACACPHQVDQHSRRPGRTGFRCRSSAAPDRDAGDSAGQRVPGRRAILLWPRTRSVLWARSLPPVSPRPAARRRTWSARSTSNMKCFRLSSIREAVLESPPSLAA